MTERVTVEQNGERFTLDVPDGTSDEQIQAFLTQQSSAAPQAAPSPSLAPQAVSMGAQVAGELPAAAGAIRSGVQALGNMPYQTAARVATDVGSMMAGHPPYASMIKMGTDAATGMPLKEIAGNAFSAAKNMVGQGAGTLATGARNVGGALLRGAMAPESLFALPYQMAAYEQEKIRANPTAPGLEYNPYAQTVRGEYATQGQAGAANTRRAVINAPFGNVNPQERAILEQDRQEKMRRMMQMEAARRVSGPVAPQQF
jgi:hypothetical protein